MVLTAAAAYLPDLATDFSTPAGMFQGEAMTQRCCAITVVKSAPARVLFQPPQRDHQSATPKPA